MNKKNSVSIIYESNLKNQNNLFSIPLKNVCGQIPISEEANTKVVIVIDE